VGLRANSANRTSDIGLDCMPHPLIIIGAGWAGLAAAARAITDGHNVIVLEERPYIGGRARSFVDATTGETIDNGQHLLMGCYREVLRMLNVAGTTHLLAQQKALRVEFKDISGEHATLDASILQGKAGVALGILRLRGLSLAERLGILRVSLRIMRGKASGNGQTCGEFLRNEAQSARAILRFWEPVILATLNASVDVAAASLLVTVMKLAFFGGSLADSTMLIPRCGLAELVHPLSEVIQTTGGSILTSMSAEEIVVANGVATAVRLQNGTLQPCSNVIIAVPPYALARLLKPEVVPQVCTSLRYSPIVSVYLWFNQQIESAGFMSMLGTTTQWVFNRRVLARADAAVERAFPGHLALTVSAGDEIVSMDGFQIVERCMQELHAILPGMQQAELLHHVVIKEKRATPCITPQVEAMREAVPLPYANVALAGDWTGTGLPATLEGAARSGVAAYEALMAS